MKITILIENRTDNPGICAEHGLSIYINTHGLNILFDAGATDNAMGNAKELGTDLEDVDFAVASHGHYDHTGGFPAFFEINEKAPLYIHKEALVQTYGSDGRPTGIAWSDEEKERISDRLILTEKETWINDDIVISGTIHPVSGYRPSETFYRADETPDEMAHEQFLAIREEGKVYVFTGCSHRGAVAVLRHAKELFPDDEIKLLTGGLHLYSASEEVRNRIINEVINLDVKLLMPLHCTGIEAIASLKSLLKERCITATAGDTYEY